MAHEIGEFLSKEEVANTMKKMKMHIDEIDASMQKLKQLHEGIL
jgi:hypothetical protein